MRHPQTVGFEIRILSNLIRREMESLHSGETPENLSCTSGWVIGYLAENRESEIFQRDLEENFSVRRSTVSSILALMEKKGLVVRTPVARDARLKKLELTDRAYALLAHAEAGRAALENKLTRGISTEELEGFFSVCEKIRENLEEEQRRKDRDL